MIIGRCERITFPDLRLCMSAKVDTGAWRTSLHVDGLKMEDGKLNFWIGDESNSYQFNDFEIIKVKSSFGKTQERYSIKLKLKIGSDVYEVLVSLSDRNNMKFPCLIGRQFIRKYGFLVNVRKKNIYDRFKKI
jgi:hypothetical protein